MTCECRGRHMCGAPGYVIPPGFENLMAKPMTGSFTHVFDGAQVASLIEAYTAPRATVTVRWRAKWWRRPWLWLRRKPTSSERVYEGVRFSPMEIHEDGSVSVDFTGRT